MNQELLRKEMYQWMLIKPLFDDVPAALSTWFSSTPC